MCDVDEVWMCHKVGYVDLCRHTIFKNYNNYYLTQWHKQFIYEYFIRLDNTHLLQQVSLSVDIVIDVKHALACTECAVGTLLGCHVIPVFPISIFTTVMGL